MPSLRINSSEVDSEKAKEAQILVSQLCRNGFVEVNTSGSTGRPKTITLTIDTIRSSAERTFRYLDIPLEGRVLCSLPLHYVAGMMQVFRAYFWGYELTFSDSSLHPLKGWVPLDISLATFTPIQWENVLQSDAEKLTSIKNVIIGGGPMSSRLISQSENFSGNLWASYGMTETASHIALRQIRPVLEPHFTALEGVEISATADCLDIKLGTERFHSNDRVVLFGERAFDVLGRVDNVINSGGYKIQAEQLEEKLCDLFQGNVIILPIEDETFGQRPVMFLDTRLPLADIEQMLAQAINKKERPVAAYYTDKFPKLDSGKIDRTTLKTNIKSLRRLY